MNKWFKLAYREMLKSCHRMRFGAVLVLKNGKVFKGHNMTHKSHPMLKRHYAKHCISIHAELHCLLQAHGENLRGANLYITRRDMVGLSKPARPCKYCMRLCRDFGIKRIHYSTLTGYAVEELY